jgi:hypothetical protein
MGWLAHSPQRGDEVYSPGRIGVDSFRASSPYAPDLNPDEGVWQYLKNVELRNVSCKDLKHLRQELQLAIMRLRNKPQLIQSFFGQAGLPIKS